MSLENALKAMFVGIVGGAALRVIMLLFYFDYDTGFFTDSFSLNIITAVFAVAVSALCMAMCRFSGTSYGPLKFKKSVPVGVVSAALAAVCLICVLLQIVDYTNFMRTGISAYGVRYSNALLSSADNAQKYHTWVWFFNMGATVCFVISQLFASYGFFSGRNILRRMPLIYIFAPIWGVSNLLMAFVFYTKASYATENLFALLGACMTLLAIFYICKLFAGGEETSSGLKIYLFGIPAVIFTFTYYAGNLVMFFMGKLYSGWPPAPVQVVNLCVCAFLVAFMFYFKKDVQKSQTPVQHGEGARRFAK